MTSLGTRHDRHELDETRAADLAPFRGMAYAAAFSLAAWLLIGLLIGTLLAIL